MKTNKVMKRIAALLFSIVLTVLLLPQSASAHTTTGPVFDGTTSGSITLNKTDGAGAAITDTSLQYTVYKVADVKQSVSGGGVVVMEYILANGITLNSGATVGDGLTVAVPTGTTAASFDVSSLASASYTEVQTNTAGTGTLLFDNSGAGLPLGLYLVKETATPAGVSVANDFLVSIPQSEKSGAIQVWNYDPVATPKNIVMDATVSKDITSGTSLVSGSTHTASLGATVSYEIETKLPSTFTITPYTTYTVTDTPSTADLIFDKDGAGAPGSFDGIVVKNKTTSTTLVKGTDYTITNDTVGNGFVIEFILTPPSGTTTTSGTNFSSNLNDSDVITVAYDAQLSPSSTASSFSNTVQIDSKYNTTTGPVTPPPVTPPVTPPTIEVYDFALQKVDGDNSNAPLAGATFAIQDSSGNYLKWTTTGGWGVASGLSDPDLYTVTSAVGPTNAIVSFKGLALGNTASGNAYKIVEISAPSGYSALTAPITADIDSASDAIAKTSGGYSLQVVNTLANSFILPGTGGAGIYLYIIGGILLIATAVFLVVRNKKRTNA